MKKIIFLLSLLFIFGCSSSKKTETEKYSEIRSLMATFVRMDVCVGTIDRETLARAYKEAWERLEDISWRMNVFDEKSDVAKVNHSYLEPVTIEADTHQVIADSVYFNHLTKGTFDITVWPLIQLWKNGAKENVLPDAEKITSVKKAVGVQNIQLLPNNQLQILNEQTKIDLGGIAAGYAVDEAVRILRKHGIANFLVDAGGDMYLGGHNCQGEPWRIGIRDPFDASKIIEVTALSDMAITTSGNYEKFYEIKNEKWSHIMNPITGYPQKGVVSASVIAPSTEDSDALATALCVLGEQEGTRLIDSLRGPYASFIITSYAPRMVIKTASRKFNDFRLRKQPFLETTK